MSVKSARGLPDIRRPSRAPEVQHLVDDEGELSRLSVDLPTKLHRRLKAKAAEDGVSIRDFLLRLLRQAGL